MLLTDEEKLNKIIKLCGYYSKIDVVKHEELEEFYGNSYEDIFEMGITRGLHVLAEDILEIINNVDK